VKVKIVSVQVGQEPWLLYGDRQVFRKCFVGHCKATVKQMSQDPEKVLKILSLRPYADPGGRAV
jgi:hypothetical protein